MRDVYIILALQWVDDLVWNKLFCGNLEPGSGTLSVHVKPSIIDSVCQWFSRFENNIENYVSNFTSSECDDDQDCGGNVKILKGQ